MIDIRLFTFITVARTKSFTKSGEVLNITQPAVSQHIKYLEEEYGVKLFEKVGRGIEPTQEGLILYKYAEEIELLYKSLKMKLKNKSSIVKTYNMGASMTIGDYIMPHILGKYKKLYENINILLQVNNTKEILEKLINGRINFALIEGTFDKNKFEYKKLKDDELILAVSPKHEFAVKKEVSMEEVLSKNIIVREKGSGTRKIFENKLMELGYDKSKFKPYMEIGSINAIKSLIEENLGYSIISKETVQRELAQGSIKKVSIKNVSIYREFNFVYIQKDSAIDDFIEFCTENIK
ncbi:MAG: LysR family transcriptional regulator [Clostridium sp.]|nr:LysR family transcriptional regulator [Clostridium sp.]